MKHYLPILSFILLCSCAGQDIKDNDSRPNVILIMTDDQGIGDFGFNGNPYIQTPNLDELASRSLNLTNFFVSPVCAPTRASLMTGRYSERTGVYDTYNGGAVMSTDEITLAEALGGDGYKTAIFGKWHLGDNYPYRPMDQGFDVSVVHRAGGMGQPGDVLNFFARDSAYFDPVMFSNGEPVQKSGYCSDVYTNDLISFIKKHKDEGAENPFFAYLSYNAPHTPLQLPQSYYDRYRDLEFDANDFAEYDDVTASLSEKDKEAARKVYGMVTNIDDNLGRLMAMLKEEDLYENTIVIFLTDNGPQQHRYRMGLRGRKSSVYSGGVQVPCLIHYPAQIKERSVLSIPVAHLDLFPSILDMCGVEHSGYNIDGISLFSTEDPEHSSFKDRPLFFEWGRGYLQKYRNVAVLRGGNKLVGNTGHTGSIYEFELYNVENDPGERVNILAENTDLALSLKEDLDNWLDEILAEENNRRLFPAYVGTPYENPVILNRNDAKGVPAAWTQEDSYIYWDVRVAEEGTYSITYRFLNPLERPGTVSLNLYPYNVDEKFTETGVKEWKFKPMRLKEGDYRVEPYFQSGRNQPIFPFYVTFERID